MARTLAGFRPELRRGGVAFGVSDLAVVDGGRLAGSRFGCPEPALELMAPVCEG